MSEPVRRVSPVEDGVELLATIGGVRDVLGAIARAVFPGSCHGCGKPADALCATCAAVARAAPNLPPPRGLERWWSPYAYVAPVRTVIADVKYRNRRAAIAPLAAAMVASMFAAGASPSDFDAVTWIPTARHRRRARGFDHARLYALAVARLVGRPAVALLDRADECVQTGRAARERRESGPQFVARTSRLRDQPVGAMSTEVGGARLLLVDDIATTGTTLRNATSVLRRSGVASVSGLTAARALPRSGGVAP